VFLRPNKTDELSNSAGRERSDAVDGDSGAPVGDSDSDKAAILPYPQSSLIFSLSPPSSEAK
jgi:hypothetical protein